MERGTYRTYSTYSNIQYSTVGWVERGRQNLDSPFLIEPSTAQGHLVFSSLRGLNHPNGTMVAFYCFIPTSKQRAVLVASYPPRPRRSSCGLGPALSGFDLHHHVVHLDVHLLHSLFVAMLQEEEGAAEAELSRRDPDRATRLWIRGQGAFTPSPPPSPSQQQPLSKGRSEDEGETETEVTTVRPADAPDDSSVAQAQDLSQAQDKNAETRTERRSSDDDDHEQAPSPPETGTDNAPGRSAVASGRLADAASDAVPARGAEADQRMRGGDGSGCGAEGGGSSPNSPEDDDDRGSGIAERVGGRGGAVVPNFRLNGFVHVCPLVSEGCKFTVKAWLQDEDD